MILVVGGTGNLGAEIVRRLAAGGETVRILARDAARAAPLVGPGVEIVAGDVRDRDAVARAVEGVTAVVSAMHGFAGTGVDPRSVDFEGNVNLIEASERAGVATFVLVSVHGASVDHPIDLFRMKHLAEERLVATKLGWTIVRPTAFMETWLGLLAAPLVAKGKTTIFGRGENPINFVSAHDVAAVVVRALGDVSMRGERVEVIGPANLSFSELVATFAEITGKRGSTGHVPLPLMRVMSWLMRPVNPNLARQIRAGVVMDTADMTASAVGDSAPTTIGDAIRRDYG